MLFNAAVDSVEPVVLAEASPITPVSPTNAESQQTVLPYSSPTPDPVEQTVIALESATPEPTEDPSLPEDTTAPTETQPPTLTPVSSDTETAPILYTTQPGDTLPVVAVRFNVSADEIVSSEEIPQQGLINPGQLLVIPNQLLDTSPDNKLMPDSEIVFSPSAVDFDVEAFVNQSGGYLSTYQEYLGSTGWTSGSDIIKRIALENSINPRILLAILEHCAHWVTGQPDSLADTYYPLGLLDRNHRGLYSQLSWAVDKLSLGYYGWRDGSVTSLIFPDDDTVRLYPGLNAGTVALQYLIAQNMNYTDWVVNLYGDESLPATYQRLFGDPWSVAQTVEPLLPSTLQQPVLILPFQPDQVWSLTGGPHAAWNSEGALAALDFGPPSSESGCVPSNSWVTAAASGLVVRSTKGVVVLDLDGDGREQTGWVITYLHVATDDRIAEGEYVEVGDPIGHPSCEGGQATGTHVHIARKYNGEWVLADGPLPFTLSGWQAHKGDKPYQGSLTKDDQTVTACTCSSRETFISLPED